MVQEQETESPGADSIMHEKNLLIIGGSGRNVGKTEFLCRLIKRMSHRHDIYGLKVSAVFPDETIYHGDHGADSAHSDLFEETRDDTTKDTSRMLRSGARRVFYLRSTEENILNGYAAFRKQIPTDAIIICESNSLAHFINPGLFILVTPDGGTMKARVIPLLKRADLIISSDGESGFPELQAISLGSDRSWAIKNRDEG